MNFYGSRWPHCYPDSGHSVEDYWAEYAADNTTYMNEVEEWFADTLTDYINVRINNGIDSFFISTPIIVEGRTYHYDDYTVTGTETWDPDHNPSHIYIRNTLTIEAGATLNLSNMTIHFGPGGKLIVKNGNPGYTAGGYLNMYRSTLTATRGCNNPTNTWAGVELWGNAGYVQTQAGGGQGYLYMHDSSRISYAEVAVRLGKYGDPARHGSYAVLRYSDFENNTISVDVRPYYFPSPTASYIQPNASMIFKCNFYRNNSMAAPCEGFIHGRGVTGLKVIGCTFKDHKALNSLYGIMGQDLGLLTSANKYSDLKDGVNIGYLYHPTGVNVAADTFYNNLRGVTIAGLMGTRVSNNVIHVRPHVNPPTTVAYTGVALQGSTAYEVKNNQFYSVDLSYPVSHNTGVLVQASGSSDNKVEDNNFNGVGVGNLSNYRNTNSLTTTPAGLVFLCNTHDVQHNNIVARGTDTTQHGIRYRQGLPTAPAGNTFYPSGISINNYLNEVKSIVYYYGNGTDKAPVNVNGNVTVIGTGLNDQCGSVANPVTNLPGTIFNQPISNALAGDTGQLNWDDVRYYAIQMNSAYGDLLVADMGIEEGGNAAANTLYNGIVMNRGLTGEEAYEFRRWGRSLMDLHMAMVYEGLDAVQLSAAQVDTLEMVADSAKMWAKYRAQAWLRAYDGRTFENEMLYPEEEEAEERMAQQQTEQKKSGNVAQMPTDRLYPNPVHDKLYVETQQACQLQLTDVTGRVLLRSELKAGKNRVDLKLPAGVFIYSIIHDGVLQHRGKVVKD